MNATITKLTKDIAVRDEAARVATAALTQPSLSLLCKLGSIITHAEEAMSPGRHHFDVAALEALTRDSEVAGWLAGMRAAAFLPVKRSAT